MEADTSAADDRLPDYAAFTVGGKTVRVPSFTLHMIEQSWDQVERFRGGMPWLEASNLICSVLGIALEDEQDQLQPFPPRFGEGPLSAEQLADLLKRRLRTSELPALTPSFVELLRISGFSRRGEAVAAGGSASTETSAPSSPNLPPEASAAATLAA